MRKRMLELHETEEFQQWLHERKTRWETSKRKKQEKGKINLLFLTKI